MNDIEQTELQQILEKLAHIENLLLSQQQNKYAGIDEKSIELWTMQDIADYCKFTVRQVQAMVSAVYFPKPVRVPSQRDPRKPSNKCRWFAGEVVGYMRRRQQR